MVVWSRSGPIQAMTGETSLYLTLSFPLSGSGFQTHMIGLTGEMVDFEWCRAFDRRLFGWFGLWMMMPLAPLQHYPHKKYCIRIIIFGWMYNWFLWKNLWTNFGIFWVSILLFLGLNILGLLFLCVHDQDKFGIGIW